MVIHPNLSWVEHWLLERFGNIFDEVPIRLRLSDDGEVSPLEAEPVASVFIPDWRTLATLAMNPEVGFGDGYADGRIQVEGDLVRLLENVFRSTPNTKNEGFFSKLFSQWLQRTQANTLRGSAKNIHHHYDLTADFYRLWLDPRLIYTCAYFPDPSTTLEGAQLAKMDYICRKLRLRPGDRVVDAGCGWGALALHMARHYGVTVKAFNISNEQILVARERAKAEDLSTQVEFIEDDYRNISGDFDVFVSVGMLEHVGAENYKKLGRVIHRAIGDSGRGLLHFIGRNQARPISPWIRKHIFPGAYVPTLRQVMGIFEPWDFSVLDVENLRLHYARTLEHWLTRFERSSERVAKMFGPEFVRAWRLYLAGSIAAFRTSTLQLYQVVFAGSECRGMPWTRADLYDERPPLEKELKWIHAMS
jgi:cyclopropane-fatty-acyl-phospholipid synthase